MAANSIATITVNTIAELKTAPVYANTIMLVVGKAAVGDNLGGFYRWDSTSTAAEDLTFLNTIASTAIQGSTGRWVRIFQRARQYPGGVLVNTGGVKTFYALGLSTAADGTVTSYLTDDGTATGNALFSTVWTTTGQATSMGTGTNANDIVIGGQKSLSSDNKTLVYQFARGNSTVLGATLSALLGLVIPGLRPPIQGTACTLIVTGL